MANTTTTRAQLPPSLKARIDKYYKATYKRVKSYTDKYQLPPSVLKHLAADLRSIVYCNYSELNITPAELTSIYNLPIDLKEALVQTLGKKTDHPLQNLFYKYDNYYNLLRIYANIKRAPRVTGEVMREQLQAATKNCSVSLYPETKKLFDLQVTATQYGQAAAMNYSDFAIIAALDFKATARELQAVPIPTEVEGIVPPGEDLAKIQDTLIGDIISIAEMPLETIAAQDGRPLADDQDEEKISKIYQEKSDERIIKLFQSNTAALAKPLEVLSDTTQAIVGLSRTPQPLNAIIASMESSNISPSVITQCLNRLPILALRKESKIIDYDGNKFYVYDNLKFTALARILTGVESPSGPLLRQAAAALSLLSNIRIGHDEDHIVGYDKKTKKPKTKRYRHFTQFVNVPNIKAVIDDKGNIVGGASCTILLHSLVKTGQRAETAIVENKTEKICPPKEHLVTLSELNTARALFKGEEGIRFYNSLLSVGRIKECRLLADVFNYDGRQAAANKIGEDKIEQANKAARSAATDEEADAIIEAAKTEAKAIARRTRNNISSGRKRDLGILYKWLDLAVENFIIKPYSTHAAKDKSGDIVISWRRFKAKEDDALAEPAGN